MTRKECGGYFLLHERGFDYRVCMNMSFFCFQRDKLTRTLWFTLQGSNCHKRQEKYMSKIGKGLELGVQVSSWFETSILITRQYLQVQQGQKGGR